MSTLLQMPAPCTESWAAMPPIGSDCRFCAACQKNIVDFTRQSDAEILAHLRKNAGRSCGRFRPEQLGRPLLAARVARSGGLSAAAAGFVALLAVQQPAAGQAIVPEKAGQTLLSAPKLPQPATETATNHSVRTIQGKVLEAGTLQPLIGCSVRIEGTTLGAVTDREGVFSIQFPVALLAQPAPALVVAYTGYAEQRLAMPEQVWMEDISLLPVYMQVEWIEALTGIVALSEPLPSKRSFKQRLYRFLHRHR